MKKIALIFLWGMVNGLQVKAQNPQLDIVTQTNQGKVEPTMWGVFFEDINLGADGGIYAELVKNRSFEFFKPLMGWKVEQKPFREGAVTVLNRKGNIANPRFLHVIVDSSNSAHLSITNEGFRGMGIKKGLRYDFSSNYKLEKGSVVLQLELINEKNETIGSTTITPNTTGDNWSKMAISLIASETIQKAKFKISFLGKGSIDLDMVSLFPEDTWKQRPGGMRADMVQLLADLKPGFIRFPGGCIVEGYDLSQRYQWKKTIGPIDQRQLIINRWNFEFAHRPTPDYFQTFGLGFLEYFQLAEDIGAAPLPILNCGMSCQYNSAEMVPLDQLEPYIQDALDLIEFANGTTNTTWGKIRSDLGHPAPFNLQLIGVGNENWGPQYLERLSLFQKAIKEKYPTIKIVASSGTDPNGERFDLLNTSLRKMKLDLIDEHYYRRPEWFLENTQRYDNYPRNSSKVFAGEYAAQSDKTVSVSNQNNWRTAISEAAFMTGLERNAAVVNMASYAPLFAHAEGWQWTPDLIWVDNLRAYGTPDYYVQKLFSTNKGTKVVSITCQDKVVAGQDSLFASATIDSNTNELILKIVNVSGTIQTPVLFFKDIAKMPNKAMVYLLENSMDAVNSFDQPFHVSPKEYMIDIKSKSIAYALAPHSFHVLKLKLKN
jgi:alpha-L-arabinofuranosidase